MDDYLINLCNLPRTKMCVQQAGGDCWKVRKS